MLLAALALTGLAGAADLEHALVWDLSVQGQKVGTRELTVKYVRDEGAVGFRRVIESWTQINGAVGPMRVTYRQRMTAHATGREPASFHSVIDQNGSALEVQARWSPSSWWVTTSTSGRSRTIDMPLNRIDISTADLMDPDTRYPLTHYDELRLLSAETGEVLSGPLEQLGTSNLTIGGRSTQVHGYVWTSPQGKSEFYYSADGFLVRYEIQLLGITMTAVLNHAPPGGVDDFPVRVGAPAIEEINL